MAALTAAIVPQDYAVLVSASVQASPPQIMLRWPPDVKANRYVISRGPPGIPTAHAGHFIWLAEMPGNATSFIDHQAAIGEAYEYSIVKSGTDNQTPFTGYGRIFAGLEAPLVEHRGKVILLVDDTFSLPLAPELKQLEQDLVADGWIVLRHEVSRQDTPMRVWRLIKTDYDADPDDVKCVFLIGRIPRYIAGCPPDGHPDNINFADDTAYAIMAGTALTENNCSLSPPPIDLQVGRVDLSDLPAFAPATELELLRQYLVKDHRFRHQTTVATAQGLIVDAMGAALAETAPAIAGWANFAPLFGASQITSGNWLPTLAQQSYRWAYGCGYGSYTAASGVTTTMDFMEQDPQAVFAILFGSYFGNWASTNDLMRAMLATKTFGLACVWDNQPLVYHMGLGETIGYCVRFTQNAHQNRFVVLMGDPTLRLHPLSPPTDAQAVPDPTGVRLSWTASSEPDLRGYHLYRAPISSGPFARITTAPIRETSFTDAAITNGSYAYLIKAIKLEISGSGSYFNASEGALATVEFQSPLPVVALSAIDPIASDNGTNYGRLSFTRSGPAGDALTVPFTVGGTAVAGVQYADLGTNIVFPPGAQQVFLPVISQVTSQSLAKNDTVIVAIQSDPAYLVGQPAEATVTIQAEDQAGISVRNDIVSGTNNPGEFIITLKRTSGLPDGAITINYSLDGTALAGIDYQEVAASVVLATGQSDASVFIIPNFNSNRWQNDPAKTVTLTLRTGQGYKLSGVASATITLIDQDHLPVLDILPTVPVAQEAGLVPGLFTLHRSGDSSKALDVYLSCFGTDGVGTNYGSDAVLGRDYFLSPSYSDNGSFSLAAGATEMPISLIPIDNARLDFSKPVSLVLLPNPCYKIGASNTATVLIEDSNAATDLPRVLMQPRTPQALVLAGSPAQIDILRSGGTNDLSLDLKFSGSAINGIHYQVAPNPPLIPAGAKSITLSIIPIPNSRGDGDQTLTIDLGPSPNYVLDAGNTVQTVTIVDIPYNVWRSRQFGTNADDPLVIGPDADPDHDGYVNFIEYVFGMNPTLPDTLAPPGWPHITLNKHDGSLELWPRDIIDLESLATKMKQPSASDLLSQYLSNRLGTPTKLKLAAYQGGTNKVVQQYLVDALDRIIDGGLIYDEQRFAGYKLSPETLQWVAQNVQGDELKRLNRKLLQESYPVEISSVVHPEYWYVGMAWGYLAHWTNDFEFQLEASTNLLSNVWTPISFTVVPVNSSTPEWRYLEPYRYMDATTENAYFYRFKIIRLDPVH